MLLHDTYFVTGHFHYVLRIGAVFGVFTAFHYYFSYCTGAGIHQRWSRGHFWSSLGGVHLTFTPIHPNGIGGIPRRYSDFPDVFRSNNFVSTYGSLVVFVGVVYWFWLVWEAISAHRPVWPVAKAYGLISVLKYAPSHHRYRRQGVAVWRAGPIVPDAASPFTWGGKGIFGKNTFGKKDGLELS